MDICYIETELQRQIKAIQTILNEKCLLRFAARHINFDMPFQLIRGVRGSGKTFTILHALSALGKKFAYIDLSGFKHRTDLSCDVLLESLSMIYGKFDTIIFDECADTPNIEDLFNQVKENGINIIGIYSGLQRLDLSDTNMPMTTFYPLSFSEYCIWHNVDTESKKPDDIATLRKAFHDYLSRGGFPVMQHKTRLTRTKNSLEKSIIDNDIRGSFRKNKILELQETAKILLENTSELINYKQIADNLNIGSEITVKKFVEAIKDSGCLNTIARFGQFYRQRTIFEKVYVADPIFSPDKNNQKKIETIVYMQLRRFCERHGYNMHYYANRNIECDFALCVNRKMKTIIQVIADYSDSEIIKEKVKGLIAMSKATGCNRLFILTDSSHDTIETKDLIVTVVPVFEFLLDKSHKIVTE